MIPLLTSLKTLVRRQANDEGTYGFWNPIY